MCLDTDDSCFVWQCQFFRQDISQRMQRRGLLIPLICLGYMSALFRPDLRSHMLPDSSRWKVLIVCFFYLRYEEPKYSEVSIPLYQAVVSVYTCLPLLEKLQEKCRDKFRSGNRDEDRSFCILRLGRSEDSSFCDYRQSHLKLSQA